MEKSSHQFSIDRLFLYLGFLALSTSGMAGPKHWTHPDETEEDALFRAMSPWVFVEYHQNGRDRYARFLNTNTKWKTSWMSVGQSLAGATVARIGRDSVLVRKGRTTQKLLYVPQTPLPRKKASLRTPEETARAQRMYSEFYMKRFIVSGKEYARRMGRESNAKVPPRKEQQHQTAERRRYREYQKAWLTR